MTLHLFYDGISGVDHTTHHKLESKVLIILAECVAWYETGVRPNGNFRKKFEKEIGNNRRKCRWNGGKV